MKTMLLAATALFGLAAFNPVLANADVTINSAAIGGAATPPPGSIYLNFDNVTQNAFSVSYADPALPGSTLSYTVNNHYSGYSIPGSGGAILTTVGSASVVKGSQFDFFAAPYLSGSNGAGFNSQTVAGLNTTTYLSTGSTDLTYGSANSAISLFLPVQTHYFGLLWGSIGATNQIGFWSLGGIPTLVGSITGQDILNYNAGIAADSAGSNGTAYVNLTSLAAFNYVTFTSGAFAFEFDNVAFDPPVGPAAAPEPLSLALLGSGLLGLGLVRRRRR
jgi:hypothetical protein